MKRRALTIVLLLWLAAGQWGCSGNGTAGGSAAAPDAVPVPELAVKIGNPGGELRSGMFALGEIEVRVESKAIVIPRSALMVDQEQSDTGSVFIVSDGRALRRSVQVGGGRKDLLWIRHGLAANDQVIVDIAPSLKDGTAVRIAADRETGGQ